MLQRQSRGCVHARVSRFFALAASLTLVACSDADKAEPGTTAGSGGGGATGAEAATTTGSAAQSTGAESTASSSSASSSTASGASDPCTSCAMPTSKGAVVASAVKEVSGIVASQLHEDAYYVHNDSGDTARFFALGSDGVDKGSYVVDGASAIDWEATAAGPCDKGRCLYFGDVGDNLEARASYTIYRVPEPQRLAPGEHHVAGEALELVYPDGSHNCETLLAHPKTGELWLVTKVSFSSAGVYRVPPGSVPGKGIVLEKLGSAKPPSGLPQFTAGDVRPDGTGILLRTYSNLFFYPLDGADIAAALALEPCKVPVAAEKQGEAVAWTKSGDGYVTVSEGNDSAVNWASCP